jgi:hypothetical protein
VKDAFEQGKAALMLLGIPEEKTPVLLSRKDIDPATVILFQEQLPEDMVDKRILRETIVSKFALEELEVLCQDIQQDMKNSGINLEINMEIVGGDGKVAKVLNLIEYLDRRGYLSHLVNAVRQLRPGSL